jgi:FMNH2-dependent dimethyl sulfone monooxygenase
VTTAAEDMSGSSAPSSVPLRNENILKLGVFAFNASGGTSITKAAGTIIPTWDENRAIAQAADAAGWEFLLPLGRWRGLGGATDFNGSTFDVFTWAAAVAAVTERIQVLATSHVPLFHPVMAAKFAATIDHVSDGRFGMNVVAGWNEGEVSMFGGKQLPHDERYLAADEWMTVVKRLWAEQEAFDFDGTYYKITSGYLKPKPLQQPHPVIVNAGVSDAGKQFTARHADFSFQNHPDLTRLAQMNATIKELSLRERGREVGVLSHGYVVCRDTEGEALDYLRYYIDEMGDWQAANNLVQAMTSGGMQTVEPARLHNMARDLIAGWGGIPFVGTAEQIVDKLLRLSKAGTSGIALHWVNYHDGIAQFNEQVLPLMIDAGLRKADVRPQAAPTQTVAVS